MSSSNTPQLGRPVEEPEDVSSDDELEAIWVDPVEKVEATLTGYEDECKIIRTQLDNTPNMSEKELVDVARRFEALAKAVVCNSRGRIGNISLSPVVSDVTESPFAMSDKITSFLCSSRPCGRSRK